MKSKIILIASCIVTPFLQFIEKFIFDDWEFLTYFAILIFLDTVLGFIKHLKLGSISSLAWGKILVKLLIYGSILIMAHILTEFTIDGKAMKLFQWIKTFAYAALIVKEGISILENIGSINPKLVPTWILKKLKEFDESGKLKKHESNNR